METPTCKAFGEGSAVIEFSDEGAQDRLLMVLQLVIRDFSVKFKRWVLAVIMAETDWMKHSFCWILCTGVPNHRWDSSTFTELCQGFGLSLGQKDKKR